MPTTFRAACELKRKVRTALFAAALLSFAPAVAHRLGAGRPPATAPPSTRSRKASTPPKHDRHRRHDPRHGLAGRQLHHLRRRALLLPATAAEGVPAGRSATIRKDLVEAADAASAAPPRSSPTIEQKLQALPGELDALRARGAEEIAAEEQRIAAAAAADRERLLEQTRREIDLQVRLAKKEILEHAADLSVQLATERIKKEVTPADQIAPGRSVSRPGEGAAERCPLAPPPIATPRRCSTSRSRRRPTSPRSIAISGRRRVLHDNPELRARRRPRRVHRDGAPVADGSRRRQDGLAAPVTKLLVLLAEGGKLEPAAGAGRGLSRTAARAPEHRPGRGHERGAAVAGKDAGARAQPAKVTGKKVELSRRVDPDADRRRGRARSAARSTTAASDAVEEDARPADRASRARVDRHMSIKADEISKIIREQIGSFAVDGRRGRGRHRHHARRRHRPRPRLRARHGRRAARVPARRVRHRAEPRRRQRRRGAARRVHARSRKATRSSAPAASSRCRSARRCSAAWSTRSASRSTARARS